MNGFSCACGWLGVEPGIQRTTEPVEYWGDRTPFYGVTQHCPECDGPDLLDVAICEVCEEQEAEPGYDDCRQCLVEQAECEAEFRRDQIIETQLLTRDA